MGCTNESVVVPPKDIKKDASKDISDIEQPKEVKQEASPAIQNEDKKVEE